MAWQVTGPRVELRPNEGRRDRLWCSVQWPGAHPGISEMVHVFETFGLIVAEHLPAESTPVDPQHPMATLDVFELCLPPEHAAGLDLGEV
jgi:hypothetical protein